MLTTLIVLLHEQWQKNLFRQSSKTAFLAIKFPALKKMAAIPVPWIAKFWMQNPEATRDRAAL
jgi:hypothetical protein